jgi:hypothetical protein
MGWVVKAMPHHFNPPPNTPLPVVQKGGWAPGQSGWVVKNIAPMEIRSPGSPARSDTTTSILKYYVCQSTRTRDSKHRAFENDLPYHSTNAQSKEWYRNLLFFSAGGGLEFHSRHRPSLYASTPFASRCSKITQQATTLPSALLPVHSLGLTN